MAEITANIVLKGVDNFSPELRKIQKRIADATKDIRDRNKAIAESFRGIASSIKNVTLTAIGFGASLFAIVKTTADAGDKFQEMAQKVGVSVEGLQKLSYAADLAGVNQEGLGTSLKFLNKNLVEARGGSKELSKAFKTLKIDPKKMKDTEEAFIKIGGAIGGLKDQQQKTALALQIFGRSGSDLIPLFNDGEDAIRAMGKELEDMGGIIGTDLAKRSDQFNDNLGRMLKWLSALKTVIGVELLPIFEEMVVSTLEWFSANKELIKLKIREFAQELKNVLVFIRDEGPKAAKKISDIVESLGGVLKIAKVLGVIWGVVFGFRVLKLFGQMAGLAFTVAKNIGGISLAAKGLATSLGIAGGALAAMAGSVLLVVYRKEATAWLKERGLGFLVDGTIIKLLEPIGKHFAQVWVAAGRDIESIKGVAENVFNSVAELLTSVFNSPLATVKGLFVTTFSEIKALIASAFTEAAGFLDALNPQRLLLNKIGISTPSLGGLQPQSAGPVSGGAPAAPAGASAGQAGRELWGRLSALTSEIAGQQQTLKKPQQVDLRIKVDAPVPTQVAAVSASPGVSIKANTGQMKP